MTENEQANIEDGAISIREQLKNALHNSSPALSSFNWTMSEDDEGDTLQIEVVLTKQETADTPTTHEMLSTLGNISVDDLIDIMINNQAKKQEDETENVEDAVFTEVDESNE